MRWLAVAVVYLAACLAPFASSQNTAGTIQSAFEGWPSEFEGAPLRQLELTDKERGFSGGFPGRIARFTDGSREIILRYVERPSRAVHPSADCLKGSGYAVENQPVSRGRSGELWGCVLAHRNGQTFKVCERIYDQSGNSWYDISSWFWSALLQNGRGPWWTVTVAERV